MAESTGVTDSIDLLLVDDSEVDRILIRRLLTRAHRIREAATAAKARASVEDGEPDLVILDYRLPDADGIDLIEEFVARHIPVIMLTGTESPEVIVEAMKHGAHDYLTKDRLTEEGLERAITNAIEKASLRRALDAKQRALADHAAELEIKNREIRGLAVALTLAEQDERRRVAELLHDNFQQLLFAVKLSLSSLHASMGTAEAAPIRARLNEAEEILDEAIANARHLAVELTPPVLDREDLAAALRWLANHLGGMYGIRIEIEADTDCRIPSRELRVLVIQIVRELLFNVVKHAEVTTATVRLRDDEECSVIEVEDQGCGFDSSAWSTASGLENNDAGFGLYSVQRRLALLGGELTIDSEPGKGCRITLTVPSEWSV